VEHVERQDEREDELRADADELDKKGDELEQRGEELEQKVDEEREDWNRKQQSSDAPGAQEPVADDE
jgi:hypothetical protein